MYLSILHNTSNAENNFNLLNIMSHTWPETFTHLMNYASLPPTCIMSLKNIQRC